MEKYKERCKHCAYLIEDNKKNWVCDIDSNKCKEIIYCAGVENHKKKLK